MYFRTHNNIHSQVVIKFSQITHRKRKEKGKVKGQQKKEKVKSKG